MATHYHQLGQGGGEQQTLGPGVASYQLEAELDNSGGLVFTYRVKVVKRESRGRGREGGGGGGGGFTISIRLCIVLLYLVIVM